MGNFGGSFRPCVAIIGGSTSLVEQKRVSKMTATSEWLIIIGSAVGTFCNNTERPRNGFSLGVGGRARNRTTRACTSTDMREMNITQCFLPKTDAFPDSLKPEEREE